MALLILDRDGVINEDSVDYIRSPGDWQPIPGSIEAIAAVSRAGFQIAVATNQSALGRGYLSLEDLEAIHAMLCQAVEEEGGRIAGIFYCPHLPNAGCNCRKPATGLLEAIARELGEPLQGAWFIGDSLRDLQAGEAAGCQPVLVKTGSGMGTLRTLRGTRVALKNPGDIPVYENLAAAAAALLDI